MALVMLKFLLINFKFLFYFFLVVVGMLKF